MLLQACIVALLGSAHANALLVEFAVVKDCHAIPASKAAFSVWILITPRWQGTAICMAATGTQFLFRSLESESVGTDIMIAALLLADLIAAISLGNSGATITPAGVDVSTPTQRMVLPVTYHSASAVVSCLQSWASSFCCYSTDTNALACTSDLPNPTACSECAALVHEARPWTACILPSGSCECHSCVTQQTTREITETHRRWLARLSYAGAPVRCQCLCFLPDPVSSTPLTPSLRVLILLF